MKSQLITILLIAGLNIPVFLELYKHVLKSRPVWLRAVIIIIYWSAAIATQTIAAFCGIIYLFFAFYKNIRLDEDSDELDVWHINARDALIALAGTLAARAVIWLVHVIYIIILVKLVKYNIKLQDVVTTYSEAKLILKLILAAEIVIIAPMVEEFVFRYFLYDKILGPRMPLAVAATLSAMLFTFLHFNVSGIPTFFGLGLFCTFIYQKKGYWAAVIAHATSNLITLIWISIF